MSYNGSGVFQINSAGQPVVAATLITSAAFNAFTADVATGLSTAITKDGQTTVTANLPMATYRHTGVGNGSARTDYAALGQVQDSTATWCGTAGGSANAITLTPSPAITAYAAGQSFRFKTGASANTGAVTVQISGLATPRAIQMHGAALEAGELPANSWFDILSDGTTFQLVNPVTFRNIPQNSQSAAYTTLSSDAGKHIYHPGADTTARVWTIDSNANVPFKIGTAITFINDTSAGIVTIAITSDTLVMAGTGTTGSRSLAPSGIATAIKMTSTRWMISGTGLS